MSFVFGMAAGGFLTLIVLLVMLFAAVRNMKDGDK